MGFIPPTSAPSEDSSGCAGFDYHCGVLHGSRMHGKYNMPYSYSPQLEKADYLYRSRPPVSHSLMPVMAASPVPGGFHE